MKYFLIDYENTGESGLKGILELDGECCVVIFYSENADKVSFDMHQKLMQCRTKLDYRKINTGKKNALDFQLSTYLGFLIAQCDTDQFYIVSKDNGYRAVLDFWKEKKVRQIDFVGRTTAKPLMLEVKSAESAKPAEPAAQPETVESAKTEVKSSEPAKQPETVKSDEPVREPEQAKPAGQEPAAAQAEPEKTERRPRRGRHGRRRSQEAKPQDTEKQNAADGAADVLSGILDGGKKPEPNVQETPAIAEEELPFTDADTLHETAAAASEKAAEKQPETTASSVSETQPDMQETAGGSAGSGDAIAVSGDTAAEPRKKTHRGGRKKKAKETPVDEFAPDEELKAQVAQVIEEKEAQEQIGRFIVKYKTKQGVNNAIVKLYGTEKAGELYKKIKPLLKDKKGK